MLVEPREKEGVESASEFISSQFRLLGIEKCGADFLSHQDGLIGEQFRQCFLCHAEKFCDRSEDFKVGYDGAFVLISSFYELQISDVQDRRK